MYAPVPDGLNRPAPPWLPAYALGAIQVPRRWYSLWRCGQCRGDHPVPWHLWGWFLAKPEAAQRFAQELFTLDFNQKFTHSGRSEYFTDPKFNLAEHPSMEPVHPKMSWALGAVSGETWHAVWYQPQGNRQGPWAFLGWLYGFPHMVRDLAQWMVTTVRELYWGAQVYGGTRPELTITDFPSFKPVVTGMWF